VVDDEKASRWRRELEEYSEANPAAEGNNTIVMIE
jgi:hypothetical protein